MRLRLRFRRWAGRVSLSTGSSILPKILGPSSFSARIFSITGPAALHDRGWAQLRLFGLLFTTFFTTGFSSTTVVQAPLFFFLGFNRRRFFCNRP